MNSYLTDSWRMSSFGTVPILLVLTSLGFVFDELVSMGLVCDEFVSDVFTCDWITTGLFATTPLQARILPYFCPKFAISTTNFISRNTLTAYNFSSGNNIPLTSLTLNQFSLNFPLFSILHIFHYINFENPTIPSHPIYPFSPSINIQEPILWPTCCRSNSFRGYQNSKWHYLEIPGFNLAFLVYTKSIKILFSYLKTKSGKMKYRTMIINTEF